jgi:hypothetical protein
MRPRTGTGTRDRCAEDGREWLTDDGLEARVSLAPIRTLPRDFFQGNNFKIGRSPEVADVPSDQYEIVGQAYASDEMITRIDRLAFLPERQIYSSNTPRRPSVQRRNRQGRQKGRDHPACSRLCSAR